MLGGEGKEGRVRCGEGSRRVGKEQGAVNRGATKEAVCADCVRVTFLIVTPLFTVGHAGGEPGVNWAQEVSRNVCGELRRVSGKWDQPAIGPGNVTRAKVVAGRARRWEGGDAFDGKHMVRACVLDPRADREGEVEAEIGQGHVRVLGAESSGFIKGGQHTGGERGEQLVADVAGQG